MDLNTNANIPATSTSQTINSSPRIEQGWQCPICKRVNAPWKSYCNCQDKYEITCDNSQIKFNDWYESYTKVSAADAVGGSDLKEGNTYVNISRPQSNKVEPNVTAWNCTNPDNCHTPHYTTETGVNDGRNYLF